MTDRFPLPDLEPPRGGLAKLRDRLDGEPARDRRRTRAWQFAVAASVALVATGIAVSPVGPYRVTLFDAAPTRRAPDAASVTGDALDLSEATHPGLVAFGMQPSNPSPVTVLPRHEAEVAIERVASDDDVVIYLVASVGAESEGLSREPIIR